MKCPFGFTAHARPLEIICMRTSQERKIFNSEYEVLRYYDNLDLFSKNFSMNNYLHKYSAVNIASDGVKGSALYYIWESLRQFSDSLDVNKRAAHFMKTIRKEQKLVFEEEPFIWKRIQKIDAIAGRAYVKENFEYKGNDKVINEQSNGSVLNRIIKRIIRHVKAY
jgi:hypothetical protein